MQARTRPHQAISHLPSPLTAPFTAAHLAALLLLLRLPAIKHNAVPPPHGLPQPQRHRAAGDLRRARDARGRRGWCGYALCREVDGVRSAGPLRLALLTPACTAPTHPP